MSLLHNGQVFPKLELATVGGGILSLPTDLAGSFAVVLVYRGAWCPFCRAQLADFEAEKGALEELGVRVVALSVDDQATGAAFVAEHGLSFPTGHSADADAVASATGAFTNPDPHYLQPTAFILEPDGTILAAVYATHAVGRLRAADVVKLVSFMKLKRAGKAKSAA